MINHRSTPNRKNWVAAIGKARTDMTKFLKYLKGLDINTKNFEELFNHLLLISDQINHLLIYR